MFWPEAISKEEILKATGTTEISRDQKEKVVLDCSYTLNKCGYNTIKMDSNRDMQTWKRTIEKEVKQNG